MKKTIPTVILVFREDVDQRFPGEAADFVQAHIGWYLHTDGGSTAADLWGVEEYPTPLSPHAIGPFYSQADCLCVLSDWVGWAGGAA